MNNLWGIPIILIGLYLFISALIKSEFIIYKLLCARSKIIWGDNVHKFYIVVGVVLTAFGILVTANVI